MTQGRAGFSLIELMFVLVIGAVLISMIMPAFGSVEAKRAARNARDAYVWLASRGRAEAIQRGQQVQVQLDPSAARAWAVTATGDTIDSIRFSGDHRATVTTSTGGMVRICYIPRGYAVCPTADRLVMFKAGGDSAGVRINTVGRVEKVR